MGAAQTRARAEKTVRVFLFSSGLQISEVLSVHVNVRYISGSPTIGLVGRVGGSLTFMKSAADVTVLLSICTCSHVDAHVHVQVQVALPSLRMGFISRVPPGPCEVSRRSLWDRVTISFAHAWIVVSRRDATATARWGMFRVVCSELANEVRDSGQLAIGLVFEAVRFAIANIEVC